MSRTDLNDAPVPGDRPQNALASRQLVVEPLRSLEYRRVNSSNAQSGQFPKIRRNSITISN